MPIRKSRILRYSNMATNEGLYDFEQPYLNNVQNTCKSIVSYNPRDIFSNR
jgi:hypothetical protein